MRTLPTLGVYGWLVAAAALCALSALKWVAGGAAQAQQLSPPDSGGLKLLQQAPLDLFQKEPLFHGYGGLVSGLERLSPPASGQPTSDWLSSYWLTEQLLARPVSDSRSLLWRSLLWSPGREIGPRKGDYWKP